MFSGIGGFELGIEKAIRFNESLLGRSKSSRSIKGRRRYSQPCCIGFSEIDKYAIETYKHHFPNHKNYGDATKIIPEELPDFDMLCGGFPCQSFSIAGKRMGFKDTRGTLFFDIARIVKVKRPQIVFLENVKGLLNHDNGRTFTTIIATLDELGYNAEWQVLNSKHFDVPQNRERVFIIGHLRGTSSRQIFPIRENSSAPSEESRIVHPTVTQAIGRQGSSKEYIKSLEMIHNVYGGFGEGIRVYEDISPTIRTPKGGGHLPMVIDGGKTKWLNQLNQNAGCVENVGKIMTTSKKPKIAVRTHCLQPRSKERPSYKKAIEAGLPAPGGSEHLSKDDGTSYCLDGGNSQAIEKDSKIRRLTPTECERLQGFPDGWTIGSDTQRYKQCGNAVTVNVIQAITERLLI